MTLFTTWHAQHHSTVDDAAKALAGKRIRSLQIHWHEDVRKWHPGQQWIWEPGGFGVFDPEINAFSIATKIFPGGLFVQSAELSFPEDAQTPIAADVTFYSPEADGPIEREPRLAPHRRRGMDDHRRDQRRHASPPGGWRREAGPQWRNQRRRGIGEYPDIYRTFVDLIDERRSLVDVAPLRLVADCLLVGAPESRRSRQRLMEQLGPTGIIRIGPHS